MTSRCGSSASGCSLATRASANTATAFADESARATRSRRARRVAYPAGDARANAERRSLTAWRADMRSAGAPTYPSARAGDLGDLGKDEAASGEAIWAKTRNESLSPPLESSLESCALTSCLHPRVVSDSRDACPRRRRARRRGETRRREAARAMVRPSPRSTRPFSHPRREATRRRRRVWRAARVRARRALARRRRGVAGGPPRGWPIARRRRRRAVRRRPETVTSRVRTRTRSETAAR